MPISQVAGIVLAAGASQRMGTPKALLVLDGVPFVSRVVSALHEGGVAAVVVVTRAELASAVAAQVGERACVVVNPRPEGGMQSSLAVGLDALADRFEAPVAAERPHGVALAVVDQPALQAATVRRLADAFTAEPQRIVVPRAPDGRRGHPVIFPADLVPALRAAHVHGVREVLWRHAERVLAVEVTDTGAFRNVNTPDELAALRRGLDEAEEGKDDAHPYIPKTAP